jgi:protein-S-isoprenylcysteine O-methyltransferase Ste14
MNLVRLILFTALIPGLVVGYVPFLHRKYSVIFDIGNLKYFGLLLITLGIILYMMSALSFLLKGKGTPTIWFAKHLKFLIGEEPVNLISSGLYKMSRNPMYLGVLNIALGQALFFESMTNLIYSGFLIVFFHLVVILIEEPHLKKKHGQEFIDYTRQISRWFGRRKNSN